MTHGLTALFLALDLAQVLPAPAQTDPPAVPAAAAVVPGSLDDRVRPLPSDAETGPDDKVDFMHLFAAHGLHDLTHEDYNAYGQFTFIGNEKPSFSARYTNLNGSMNSLLPTAEFSWTGTATLFLGGRLWHGAEAYLVPEVISEVPLSHLVGLGSTIQNAELEKFGGAAPTLYISRVYLRQTIDLGGARVQQKSDPTQLAGAVDSRRLVLTAGKFSVLDFFDKNSLAGDLRRQFMNMAFLTYAAYDFAADARGYTWGGVAELYVDSWAIRFARIAGPHDPNQLPVDYRLWQFYGDQLEIEHDFTLLGQPGAVRVLGYRNEENMASFSDAIAAFQADPSKNANTCQSFNYGSTNQTAPDFCWARKPNVKLGVGLNLEQYITEDVGAFFRGMYSDGQTEVYSFTSTDRSLSLGVVSKGTIWGRHADSAGVALGVGWISSEHAAYLNLGGVDGFIGDGRLNRAPESVAELFYSWNVVKSLWLSLDYQHITNPAYNADRGPVEIFGGRLHAEF